MTESKWLPELVVDTRLETATRRTLGRRFQVVHRYLTLAVNDSAQDTEYVHQLRVGTRRAGAALRLFAVCLPEKVHRKARRFLRRIRRAAGAARDWDVFL